jgi:hypothetical protein
VCLLEVAHHLTPVTLLEFATTATGTWIISFRFGERFLQLRLLCSLTSTTTCLIVPMNVQGRANVQSPVTGSPPSRPTFNSSARYGYDLAFHQTSGSGMLDQQEGRRTIGSKSARCRFSFKRLNPIPVCQPSRLIVSSKTFISSLRISIDDNGQVNHSP